MKNHISSQIIAPSRRLRLSARIIAALAAALLAAPLANAADKTWAPGTTNFNLGTNWTGGLPGTGDNANFSGAAGTQPQLTANTTVQGLTFATTTSSGYTLSTAAGPFALTLTNTGTAATSAINAANTSGTNTISAPIVLGAASAATQTFTQATGGTLAISGVISEANAGVNLTYAGGVTTAAKYTITGSNTYTGNTVIGETSTATTLVSAQNSNAFGTGAGTVSVSATSELDLLNNITITKALTLNGNGISSAGNLRNISGNNEWSGNITLSSTAGPARVASDGGNLKLSGNITPATSASITFMGNGTGEVSGVMSGTLGVSHSSGGTGTWIFSGANTYTGTSSINNGALSVSSINSVATNAGLGTVHSASSSLGAPTTVTNGTIGFGATGNTGKLIYTGTGETTDRVINLTGTTGGGTIDQSGTGLLKFISNVTALGLAANDERKTLTLQGSTAGTGQISGNIVDSTNGTAGQLATSVTKAGTGTWTLSGTNTYTGNTTISAGTLSASNIVVSGGSSNLGNATSAVVFGDATGNKGTLSYTGNSATYTRGFTVNGSGAANLAAEVDVVTAGQTLTISTGNITGTGILVVGGSGSVTVNSDVSTGLYLSTGTLTLNGVMSGASSILKYGGASGAGTLTVTNAANSFGGGITTGGWAPLTANATTVLANTGSNSALGSGGTITINNTTVNLTGFTAAQTTDRSWNVGNVNAALNNSGSNTVTLSGAVSNNAGANGTLALGGTYTAGTNAISGAISNGSNTLAMKINATGTKWAFSGLNTYTGGTTVTVGTLLADTAVSSTNSATGTGSVSVAVNAILGGSGQITPGTGNSISVANGGFIAPGDGGIGTLTLNGANTGAAVLSLASGAKLTFELNSGLQSDRIALLSGATNDIVFGGSNAINFSDLTAGSLAHGAYTLFTADVAGAYSGFGNLSIGTGLGAYTGSTLQVVGNNIMLNVVPEPATWGLLAFSLTTVMVLRRRRAN